MLPLVFTALGALSKVFFLVGYVTNENSYPHPLTPEEEMMYFNMYKDGNEEARNILVERNLRLVASIVNKKYYMLKEEVEDLNSIGSIGLLKAIKTFDYSKNVKLSTYAGRCIENEILMYLRKTSRVKNEIHLEDPVDFDKDGNEVTLMDRIASDHESVVDKLELNMLVKWLYDKLSSLMKGRERTILIERFGLFNQKVKTQCEIASELNISRSYVSRIENRAVKKLIKAFNKEFQT